MNKTAIESLRSFAVTNNEIDFAHLCTAALAGEGWAVGRIASVVDEWCFAPCDESAVVDLIGNIDTARPDGAIARKMEIEITVAEIVRLREAAVEDGDDRQVECCDLALSRWETQDVDGNGDVTDLVWPWNGAPATRSEARRICAEVISISLIRMLDGGSGGWAPPLAAWLRGALPSGAQVEEPCYFATAIRVIHAGRAHWVDSHDGGRRLVSILKRDGGLATRAEARNGDNK